MRINYGKSADAQDGARNAVISDRDSNWLSQGYKPGKSPDPCDHTDLTSSCQTKKLFTRVWKYYNSQTPSVRDKQDIANGFQSSSVALEFSPMTFDVQLKFRVSSTSDFEY